MGLFADPQMGLFADPQMGLFADPQMGLFAAYWCILESHPLSERDGQCVHNLQNR